MHLSPYLEWSRRALGWALAIVTGAMLMAPTVTLAAGTDPATVVTNAIAAFNAHDASTTLAYYANDAKLSFTPGTKSATDILQGTSQILAWLKTDDATVTVQGAPTVDGDVVTVHVQLVSATYQKIGVATLDDTLVFVVQSGKIQSQTSTLTPASTARLLAAIKAARAKAASAQTPAQMPNTGAGGGQPYQPAALVLLALLVAGLGTVRLSARRR